MQTKIDELISEIKSFNILDESWFKEKTKIQLKKKLIALQAGAAADEKRAEEDRRALKK